MVDLKNEKLQKIYDTGKECIKMASGYGLGILFGAFTQAYMPAVGIPVKASIWLGTKVFTSFVADKTDAYIDKTFDETAEMIIEAVNPEETYGDRET